MFPQKGALNVSANREMDREPLPSRFFLFIYGALTVFLPYAYNHMLIDGT